MTEQQFDPAASAERSRKLSAQEYGLPETATQAEILAASAERSRKLSA